jgi:hypothetical protein
LLVGQILWVTPASCGRPHYCTRRC